MKRMNGASEVMAACIISLKTRITHSVSVMHGVSEVAYELMLREGQKQ